MIIYALLRRYWWIVVSVAAIPLSITFSAEFGWDAISDDTRGFFSEWAIDWLPALATFAVAAGVLQQVFVIRRGQRTEYAPVLRLDLELAERGWQPISDPASGYYASPYEDEGLDWRREAGAESHYLKLKVKNQQRHAAGSAQEVEIGVSMRLPIEPFDFTLLVGYVEPDIREIHAVVDLGGLNWSSVEILTVDFWDDSDNHYTKAHGLGLLERDRDGKVAPAYIIIE